LTPQSVVNDVLDRKIAGKEISVPLIKREIDKAKATRTGQELEAANLTTKKAADESEAPPTGCAGRNGKDPRREPDKTPDPHPIKEIRDFTYWSRMTTDHQAMAHNVAKDEWFYLEKDLLEIERLIRNMRSVQPSSGSATVRAMADRAEA
jgi:hypothetical protein